MYELALTSLIKNDQECTVYDMNEGKKKNVKVSEIVEIIEARVYEIFSIVKKSNSSIEEFKEIFSKYLLGKFNTNLLRIEQIEYACKISFT